jgi:hypothetical protein
MPKFDEVQTHVQSLRTSQRGGRQTTEVVMMEVPLPGSALIVKGIELAGKKISLSHVIIRTRGEDLKRQKIAALIDCEDRCREWHDSLNGGYFLLPSNDKFYLSMQISIDIP